MWGAVTIIFGVVVLLWPAVTVAVLQNLLGLYLLVAGVAQVIVALFVVALEERESDSSRPAGSTWQVTLGVISAISGGVVLAWRADAPDVLALSAGGLLVLIGVIQIATAFGLRAFRTEAAQPQQVPVRAPEQQHLLPGQQPPVTGQQQPVTGQQQPLTGQQPTVTGQQQPVTGQQ